MTKKRRARKHSLSKASPKKSAADVLDDQYGYLLKYLETQDDTIQRELARLDLGNILASKREGKKLDATLRLYSTEYRDRLRMFWQIARDLLHEQNQSLYENATRVFNEALHRLLQTP